MNGVQTRLMPSIMHPRRQFSSTRTWLILGYTLFLLAAIYTLYVESYHFDLALFRGMFVPDSVNMAATFDDQATLTGGVPFEESLKGPSLLFGWLWIVDPSFCIWLNVAMMLAAGFVICRIVDILDAPRWAVLGLFLNPYLMLVAVGPNKEIPLILLTATWLLLLITQRKGWQVGALLIAFLAYLMRDGYGASLAIVALFLAITRARARSLPLFYFLLCVGIAGLFGILVSIIPILARNYSGFQEGFDTGTAVGNLAATFALDPLSLVGGIVLFLLRIIYNALTLAIFPILNTEYNYYFWLGISYWVFGISNLAAVLASLYQVIKSRAEEHRGRDLAAALVLATLCSISVSQFVQPRYMMPVMPFGFIVLATLPNTIRWYLSLVTGALVAGVIGLYALSGQAPLPAEITLHDPPAFLWTAI